MHVVGRKKGAGPRGRGPSALAKSLGGRGIAFGREAESLASRNIHAAITTISLHRRPATRQKGYVIALIF